MAMVALKITSVVFAFLTVVNVLVTPYIVSDGNRITAIFVGLGMTTIVSVLAGLVVLYAPHPQAGHKPLDRMTAPDADAPPADDSKTSEASMRATSSSRDFRMGLVTGLGVLVLLALLRMFGMPA